MIRIVFSFFILAGLYSCAKPPAPTRGHFAFDSLLQSQILWLSSRDAAVSKTVELNGTAQTITIAPVDTGDWRRELELFARLEHLNNRETFDQYRVTTYPDPGSNLTIRHYHADALPLMDVKLYYLANPGELRKVEASIRQRNSLYQSAENLSLIFTNVHNKSTLTSYSVTGGQHMVFGDSVQFSNTGSITIQ